MGSIQNILDVMLEKVNKHISDVVDIPWQRSSYSIENEIMVKAFKIELENKYRNYYRYLLNQKEAEDVLPSLKKVNEIELLKDGKITSRYIFITINPNNTVNDRLFMEKAEKAFKKVWIVNYVYVIEQRGENEEELGKGFHIHALIDKGDYRFSHCVREFKTSFNRMCDTSNIHCFNVSYCKDIDISKRLNYMLGQKKDESKWKKQEFDIVYRKENGFKPYYGEKEYFESIVESAQKG